MLICAIFPTSIINTGKNQQGGNARTSQVAPAVVASKGSKKGSSKASTTTDEADVRRITAANTKGQHADINVLDQIKLGGGAGLGLDDGDQQESALDNFIKSWKQGTNELFHLLLRTPEMNGWLQIGLLCLEALQVLSFALSYSKSLPWRDTPAVRPVSAALNVFNLGITEGTFP